jgi:acetylornithine deacetylase/succinyl-diaminopimelate desuccinylase family protein
VKQKIRGKIRDYRAELVAALSELITIPTANPPGRAYRQCVDYLSRRLEEWGIDHEIISVPDGKFPRFSIVGSHGKGEKSLHFHGHYDVVPPASSAQFIPRLKRGILSGRGSSDMKSGLVVILYALRLMKELSLDLKGRISFSFVPDEESGGQRGTKYLVDRGFLPEKCLGMLMPEPTSGSVWSANKGALTYRITVLGKPAHVGLAHRGVNAFEQMVEVACSLLTLKKAVEKRKTSMAVSPEEASRSVMLIGGEAGSGVSFNLVPERSYFTIDRRINPEETIAAAKKEIEKILETHRKDGVRMEAEVLQEGEPSAASTETALASALGRAVAEIKGRAPEFELCPGLCEIRFFNRLNIPAYAYGPGLLEVSHGPEEYVRLNDVLDCTAIYALTAYCLLTG